MGFLFVSILLSAGLTVILNRGLRRAAVRAQERQRQQGGTRDAGPAGAWSGVSLNSSAKAFPVPTYTTATPTHG
jgi:hypothetical protein